MGVRERRWRTARAQVLAELAALGLPVFVKPAHLGSSLGIVKVNAPSELAEALEQAFEHDALVIVEAMAAGSRSSAPCSARPPTAGLLESEPGEIVFTGDWYDYAAKYTPGGMELRVPARISRARATAGARARAGGVRTRGLRGARARRLLRRRRAGAGQRAEHDARLHADERLREADGAPPGSATRSSSTVSAGWRSSATSAGAPPGRADSRAGRRPAAT